MGLLSTSTPNSVLDKSRGRHISVGMRTERMCVDAPSDSRLDVICLIQVSMNVTGLTASHGQGDPMTNPPGWSAPGSGSQEGRQDNPPPRSEPGSGPPPGRGGWGGGMPPGSGPPGAGPGPSGMGYVPPPGPKPGIIPLRPIGLGEILDGAVTYIRQNPKATLGLSAIIVGISNIILLLAQLLVFRGVGRLAALEPADFNSAQEVLRIFAPSIAAMSLTIVVTVLANLILTGMLTAVVGRAVLGQRATMSAAWRQVAPRIPALLGTAALIVGAIAGLLACFVAPGLLLAAFGSTPAGAALAILAVAAWVPVAVWIYVIFSLATPTVVLERAGVLTALGRSRGLVRGSWWRVFGILALAVVITMLIQAVLSAPFSIVQQVFFGAGGMTGTTGTTGTVDSTLSTLFLGQVIVTVGAILAGTVAQPFSAGVPALLYTDLRMRREALDMQLQHSAGVRPTPPEAPAPGGGPHPHGPPPPPASQ